MVRLKFLHEVLSLTKIKKSQFHYGSIEMLHPETFCYSQPLSQFHYGSIEIKKIPPEPTTGDESQFHYGSIEIMGRNP